MSNKAIAFIATLMLAAAPISVPAYGAGGGGGDGGGGSSGGGSDASGSSAETPSCTRGMVWDKRTSKCVKKTSSLDTDSLFETGRKLAYEGRYGEAIGVLSLAADRSDARVMNMLGYSHRKQGRIQVGLGYYRESVRLDPDYTLVREYMGEAFLQLGDLAAAEDQLREIGKRCGTGCAEYAELEGQIEAYKAGERSL